VGRVAMDPAECRSPMSIPPAGIVRMMLLIMRLTFSLTKEPNVGAMFCYFASGIRRYDKDPILVNQRPCWEFMVVTTGRIGMVHESGPDILRQKHAWLASPNKAYGWTGEAGRKANVIIFHFMTVPEPIRQGVPPAGHLEFPLSARQLQRLREISRLTRKNWDSPKPVMIMQHEHVLLEICLMAYESGLSQPGMPGKSVRQRVHKAMHYFTYHLERNPGLEEIAREVGTSCAHLRRHFHATMQTSPKKVFDQLRFQKALQLMADTNMTLESIGQACGFESPSAFSRAFKLRHGCSPAVWRGRT